MKNLKILSIFLMLVIVFAGCKKKDDFTGLSQLTPTNPTITVDLGTIPTVIDGIKQTHKITLNMDVAQIVDVTAHIMVLEGTATQGADFDIPSSVTIKAGRTSASFEVTFLPDEIYEETETFKIQIGDERVANATMTPVTADFTITNYTEDDLKLSLSWANTTAVYDNATGEEYSADELADMIFTVYHIEGDSIYTQADGGSFEELIIPATAPDGTYRVSTSFYAITDEGVDSDLDFTLNYYQIGLTDEDELFEGFLSLFTYNTCAGPHNMKDITKVGTTWTWADYVDPLAEFLGAYGGTDGTYSADYDWLMPSEVVTSVCGSDLYIDGLNYGWMVNIWGEEVLESIPLLITLNGDNSITVADQYYMKTLYDGSEYPYNIVNVTGTWAAGGVLHIEYDMDQEGFLVAQWALDNGYSDTNYFIADITLGAKNAAFNKAIKKIKR